MFAGNRRGQAALEYALTFAALVVVALVLAHFVRASRKSAERTAVLLSSENS